MRFHCKLTDTISLIVMPAASINECFFFEGNTVIIVGILEETYENKKKITV
jgi:hypothetical protein